MADSFHGVIAFAVMASMLVVGVALRARFRFLQQSLIPASLMAGILGFALVAGDLALGYKSSDFSAFTFHFFTLSFMSLCLTGGQSSGSGGGVVWGGS